MVLPTLLLTGIFLLPVAGAQSEKTAPAAAAQHITLDVTVNTKSGDAVDGLTAADFKVLDNKAVQPITSFRALTGAQAQTEVILVLDDVNLPYTRLAYARQQMGQMLSAHDGKLPYPTTLAILLDSGMKMQPVFTTDGNALRSSLDRTLIGLRTDTRSTGFYGAVERFQVSLSGLERLVDHESTRPGRKLIVWISPGWPILSGPEVQLSSQQMQNFFGDVVELSTKMREAQITVDAVNPIGTTEDLSRLDYYENFLNGVRSPGQVDIGDLSLQVLSVQSGGMVLNGSNDIAGLVERCFKQRETLYELSFTPAAGEHADEYHQIRVDVARPGVTVHSRTGYYAGPTYAAAGGPK
ncbi:MAG TPA: VWA domain-containing protein [Acidobacteriaceae bacterium]|jgi:VWFA-related protein|nr:VWA domain-containing protein [Acidobacteriaceae bacterium]